MAFDETAEWDQQKQNNLLSTLAARGYNAFGVFGVSPTDINTTFADLKSQGLTVASLGSCPAGGTNEAAFCLSTDVELAAYKATRAAIDAMGGQGTLVHLTGNNVDANTQLRMKGVSKAVSESGGKVRLLQTITDIDKDLQTAQKAVSDLLAAKGSRIQGVVATAYNPAVAAADAVSSAGSKARVVAIDDDAKILSSIRKGSVTATVVQNPVAQADIGAWALALLQTKQCTVRKPGQTFVKQETILVEIASTDGVRGTGYSYTIGTGGSSVLALLQGHLLPLLVGEDARNVEGLWQRLFASTRSTTTGAITSLALAAVDTALWDLRCKRAGEPLWRLAGGHRREVPVYDTEGGWLHLSPDDLPSTGTSR